MIELPRFDHLGAVMNMASSPFHHSASGQVWSSWWHDEEEVGGSSSAWNDRMSLSGRPDLRIRHVQHAGIYVLQ
jgi:hypothetical protein